jgi:hypothetical protein
MPNVAIWKSDSSASRSDTSKKNYIRENQITQISATKHGGFAKYCGKKPQQDNLCNLSKIPACGRQVCNH